MIYSTGQVNYNKVDLHPRTYSCSYQGVCGNTLIIMLFDDSIHIYL